MADASSRPPMERMTQQRRAILSCFEAVDRPLSPGELLDLARRSIPNLGLSTVYRTVRALEESRQIVPVDVPGDAPRYERADIAAKHHHHFHCRTCDRLYDIHGCPGGLQKLLPTGFQLEGHQLTLTGVCDACGDDA